MQAQKYKTEIAALEFQVTEFITLLNECITDDEILSVSRVILQEMRRMSQRIIGLNSLDEVRNN